MKNKFYKNIILANILLILCSWINLSWAQKTTGQPYIKIVTEHLPPFQIATSSEQVSGFATDVITAAMAETAYSFSIKIYPWSRSYHMALNNENTCIYSIAKTVEREHLFTWVNTIAERNASFIGLAAKQFDINSIEDAKRYTTAVIRDDVTHQLLLSKGFKEGVNLYVVNNTHSLLKLMVQRTGIDLILIDAFTVKHRAELNNLDPALFKKVFQLHKKPLDYYLACNVKTSSAIIEQIHRAINHVKDSGEIKQIINKWQYPNIKVKNVPSP